MITSKPSFCLDLDAEETVKPLPPSKPRRKLNFDKKVTLPAKYPSYEERFFTNVKDCAEKISKLRSPDRKHFYNDELSKVFVTRDNAKALKLFMDISMEILGEGNEIRTDRKTH